MTEEIFVPLGFFAFLAFVWWLQTIKARHQLRTQLELGMKSLEKIGNAEELNAFLETDAGRRFIDIMANVGSASGRGFLLSLQAGIIFITMGLAFLVLAATEGDADFTIPATLSIFLGSGLVVASLVARRLSRTWMQTDKTFTVAGQHPYRDDRDA